MSELDQIRNEINAIDKRIIFEFEKRMECSLKVARYKIKHNLPVLDISREREIIDRCVTYLSDQNNFQLKNGAAELMKTLMKISRNLQTEFIKKNSEIGRAAFQGEPGANSEAALKKYFGNDIEPISLPSFEDVFKYVESGKAAYGVVPIENSSTGGISKIYDLLGKYNVYITGEQKMLIEHCLIGLKDSLLDDITDVYSHEQALMQCEDFLKKYSFKLHPYFNTATSAKFVAEREDIHLAAIASAYAAEIYGLKIIETGINNASDNTTRFIIISSNDNYSSANDKASVIFTLQDRSGALSDVLNVFAKRGLNMVKIESRPLRDHNFEYMFYVDFEGIGIKESIEDVLRTSRSLFADFKTLGIYKKGMLSTDA